MFTGRESSPDRELLRCGAGGERGKERCDQSPECQCSVITKRADGITLYRGRCILRARH